MKKILLLFGVLIAFVCTGFAEDSDLVKAAKKEKERRAKIEAKKVLTNQDIEEFKSREGTPVGIETTSSGEESTGEETGSEEAEGSEDLSTNEEYWRQKRAAADQRIAQAEAKVERVQSEINELDMAFWREADGVAQRGVIESEKNIRIDKLSQAQTELDEARAALEALEEEARRNAVPPGWVR